MKFNFKKIAAVSASFLMVGMTMGIAGAVYPTPFVQNGVANYAVVYGTGSGVASSDLIGATKINDDLLSLKTPVVIDGSSEGSINSIITGDFSDSVGVTENEIILGRDIGNQGKLRYILTDNRVPSLLDEKIYFDDGISSKTSFSIHEEILLGNMSTKTTFDENDLEGTALTNNKELGYRYIFEEALDVDRIGHEDADTLKITILGIEYEVSEFGTNFITVTSSKQNILMIGETVKVGNKSLTINDIFFEKVQINNQIIAEGQTKKIDGLEVKVETIAYHSGGTSPSKVILRVGEKLTTTYNDGDSYIGEDEDKPEWVWIIDNPGESGGYIGVQYDLRQIDSDDDLVYVGENYAFPENYVGVLFEGLTDVEYNDFEVSFDNSLDLYEAVINSNERLFEDAKVVVIKGSLEDSFTVGGEETNRIYLYYNPDYDSIDGSLEVFYSDIDKDYSDSVKPRFAETFNLSSVNIANIGNLISGDTNWAIKFFGESRTLVIGDMNITFNPNGNFTHLGTEDEKAEDAELVLSGEEIGEYEEDILDHYGLIIESPESNGDDDVVSFSVPEEQVFAKISVKGQGKEVITDIATNETTTTTDYNIVEQFGSILIKDTEIASAKDMNLIIVGGSCINSAAARILGSTIPLCGEDWTKATGAGSGQFLVKEYVSPYNPAKVALIVAGYEAIDTTAAVNSLFTTV